MIILAIETSCDETAISLVEAKGGFARPVFRVLAHALSSQIAIHQKWGGVVPNIAKREHGKALVPLLLEALTEAKILQPKKPAPSDKLLKKTAIILEREPDLLINFLEEIPKIARPKIDAIAVTYGPGLEPALWVGINFAKALSLWWDKPVIPVNHMEGHLFSSLASDEKNDKLRMTNDELTSKAESWKRKAESLMHFPAVALLASGGHTEIVLATDWLKYQVIGRTRDDAVGEAFDKVARLLGLPYPGGPEIAKLAENYELRITNYGLKTGKKDTRPRDSASVLRDSTFRLPRPMINSGDFDFSFSGLKTAVLYLVKKLGALTETDKIAIAHEFQTAAVDVLIAKTLAAVKKFEAKTLVVGGGVIANRELKRRLKEELANISPKTELLLPDPKLSTDNATMIALAAYFHSLKKKYRINPKIVASGNLSL
ncbi:MAG: tRNA (adenosine(37)-N6)-threonylcarbamoyltransferase complex transferase subunit TsaD [Candidatus Vogelbacteria bacterium]|nr:tRNA (adenosine(37)-N6)-threonylcarbamoyltransferase complex transferase subunit TsaD [Candidatus Vogelbacteria bacterium]